MITVAVDPIGLFTVAELKALEVLSGEHFSSLTLLGVEDAGADEPTESLIVRLGAAGLRARGLIAIEQTTLTVSPTARMLIECFASSRGLAVAAEHDDGISFLLVVAHETGSLVVEPSGDDLFSATRFQDPPVATALGLVEALRSSKHVETVAFRPIGESTTAIVTDEAILRVDCDGNTLGAIADGIEVELARWVN